MPYPVHSKWIDTAVGWSGASGRTRARLLEVFCDGIRMRSLVGNLATLLIIGTFIIAKTPTPTHVAWLALTAAGGCLPRAYAARLRAKARFDEATERKALCFIAISFVYGLVWGAGPLLLLPHLPGEAAGILLVTVVLGTIMGPYAAIPGILYARLAATGSLTLVALAWNLGLDVALIGGVITLWLGLRTDVWRGYHRAIRDQLESHELLASRQARLEQANHEKDEINRALTRMAETDPLTGTGNRRRFLAWLDAAHAPLALIVFDVDRFKEINDSLGHHGGDLLLQALVRIVDESLGDTGRLARMGGDEFAILLPGADASTALATAEYIRERIAWRPLDLNGTRVRVTISLGIAVADKPGAPVGIAHLLSEADTALYVAKRQGRNRAAHADPRAGQSLSL
ncbi:GGDEF domain-containing protein [Salinisphaera hydrothermalis]|uniref:GGDEF domain-containing protein n=1 Tax=Salinisphaera hydrothermalis TaxID=563188 RepID=UPI0033400F60